MKKLKYAILISLVFALLSCRSAQINHSIQTNQCTPINVNGVYEHQGSGMVFPENIGKFQRIQIIQYAPDEKDVGVGYNLDNSVSPVVITVYIYPAPGLISWGSPSYVVEGARTKLFQDHLHAVKREIMGTHPDAKILSDVDDSFIRGQRYYRGRKVTFQFEYNFGNIIQDSISQLYLYQNDKWMIKYRATYPETTAVESEAVVIDFINEVGSINF